VELYSILVDDGDLTETGPGCRVKHMGMIASWIEVAGRLGAERVRIVAGQRPPSPETIALAGGALRELAAFAATRGVKVSTENFGKLAVDADAVLGVLDAAGPDVGLCADFGNFSGQDKMANLTRIMPRATSIHAKAIGLTDGTPDWAELGQCLGIAKAAGFAGPVSLIQEGKGDPWNVLDELRRRVLGDWG
jgi:sugar phosphate isomerase/epimerase